MKNISIDSNAVLYDSLEELSKEDQYLMEKAIEAVSTSYSPYSNFKVGASVLLQNGEIISGSNQENAAYPSGMCAERVTIWKAATQYPNIAIQKIAISARTVKRVVDKPVGPCGACRQSMLEYEFKQKENIELLFMGEKGPVIKTSSIKSLLPFSFDNSYL